MHCRNQKRPGSIDSALSAKPPSDAAGNVEACSTKCQLSSDDTAASAAARIDPAIVFPASATTHGHAALITSSSSVRRRQSECVLGATSWAPLTQGASSSVACSVCCLSGARCQAAAPSCEPFPLLSSVSQIGLQGQRTVARHSPRVNRARTECVRRRALRMAAAEDSNLTRRCQPLLRYLSPPLLQQLLSPRCPLFVLLKSLLMTQLLCSYLTHTVIRFTAWSMSGTGDC